MQTDLLVLGAHEMIDDVGAARVAASVTKPFLARHTLEHRTGAVDAAVTTRVFGQIERVVECERMLKRVRELEQRAIVVVGSGGMSSMLQLVIA